MDVKKTGVLLLILCFATLLITAQVTFNPDPNDDVQLQVSLLTPVYVTTVQCYSSSPLFKVQYVAVNDHAVQYNLDIADRNAFTGYAVNGSACGQNQYKYRTTLIDLHFIGNPVLVGRTFKLKVTLDNSEENSSFSSRTYTFPAPFNLTGSSVSAILNSEFTWTCRVTSDYPIIEWYRGYTTLVQVGIVKGICATYAQHDSYIYNCQQSALTYTLTIPGSSLTEELQGSLWRCTDVNSSINGSKFMVLNVIVPVTTVTISPGSRSTIDVYEKQNVTFSCTTNDATPSPKILWFVGSSDVTPQAGSNRTTLTLHVTILYHQMAVKCAAWNSGNTANPSDSTTLNVKSSAKFVTDQRYQVIHLNRTASVGITFYCNPPATMSGVEWINKTDLNDQPVGSSEFVLLSIVEDNVKLVIGNNNLTLRGQRAFLNFTSVESYHSGYYVLKIKNGASLISGRGITLDVSAEPNPPANLTVQCREGVAQLSWSYTDIYNSELSFHLLYKEEDEDTYKVLEKEYTNAGRGQLLYANIMNIKPKTVYHFKIASKNDKGLSEYTDTKTCVIFDNKIDTSSTGPSVGGVAGGLTAVFLVLIAVLIGVIIMRERRYRLEKGEASKGNKALTMKYEDVQSSNYSNEQDVSVSEEHSQDERSTYEEVQNSRDDHTYDHV